MERPSKKTIVWTLIAVGGVLCFCFSPPERLSPVELKRRASGAVLESVARDVKTYMRNHGGLRPVSFSCLAEIDEKYSDRERFLDYALPTNQMTDILAFEKPGLWKERTIAVYMNGMYGTLRIREDTLDKLLNGTTSMKELRTLVRKAPQRNHRTAALLFASFCAAFACLASYRIFRDRKSKKGS